MSIHSFVALLESHDNLMDFFFPLHYVFFFLEHSSGSQYSNETKRYQSIFVLSFHQASPSLGEWLSNTHLCSAPRCFAWHVAAPDYLQNKDGPRESEGSVRDAHYTPNICEGPFHCMKKVWETFFCSPATKRGMVLAVKRFRNMRCVRLRHGDTRRHVELRGYSGLQTDPCSSLCYEVVAVWCFQLHREKQVVTGQLGNICTFQIFIASKRTNSTSEQQRQSISSISSVLGKDFPYVCQWWSRRIEQVKEQLI